MRPGRRDTLRGVTDHTDWPNSQLIGRPLDPAELEESGVYMTLHVGGPLEGDVVLTADLAAQRVSVVARWGPAAARLEAHADALPMAEAEMLAAQWADELGAGHEPATD
jgi:hypothetical protein